MASGVSTRSNVGAYPPCCSSRRSKTVSSSESSTIKTRSGLLMLRRAWYRCRLVQDEPVPPQLPHGLCKPGEVHRLEDIAVGAVPVTLNDVAVLSGGGEDHDRQEPGSRVSP